MKDETRRHFFHSKAVVFVLTTANFLGACSYLGSSVSPASSVSALVRQPVTGQDFFQKGMKLAKAGDHTQAVSYFEKACDADPRLGMAYLEWAASLLYVSEDHSVMSRLLKQAVSLLPTNPRARVYYGQALMRQAKSSEAIAQWQKALQLRPSMIDPRIDLADAYERKGESTKARNQLETVLVMKPSHVQARVRLGQLYATQKNFLKAAQQIEKAAVQTQKSAALFRRAAQFYASAGQVEDARRLRAKADKIDPPRRDRNLRPLRKARRFKGS